MASSAPDNAGVRLPPTPAQLQSAFDHGIWYALSLWPALHVAVQNSWGGADSSEKRDWFAGAVSDLFTGRQDTDAEDLEAFLLQTSSTAMSKTRRKWKSCGRFWC
jgi:pre-rRNA-processing protein TSR2